MALLGPHHRHEPPRSEGGPHPAICLAAGFGVIAVAATVVHILMGVIF